MTFRKIVLATLVSYIVLLTLPYTWEYYYSPAVMNILSWWGYGSILDLYGYIPYAFALSYLVSLSGMYFYKKWSRSLFLFTSILSILSSPMWGVYIMPNIDAIFAHINGLGSGAVLALAYFSEVKNEFETDHK